jgi:hypothetical protein
MTETAKVIYESVRGVSTTRLADLAAPKPRLRVVEVSEHVAPAEPVRSAVTPPSVQDAKESTSRTRLYEGVPDFTVWRELSAVQTRARELREQLELRNQVAQLDQAYAGLSREGLFILGTLAENEDGTPLQLLGENLTWSGWLSVARLLKAGLIDENGETVGVTRTGDLFLRELGGSG